MSLPLSLPLLQELYTYNYWARDRQLQACAALTEEQYTRLLENSFPSLRDTLTHMVAVEWLWLERWRGNSPKTVLAPHELPNLAALSGSWRKAEAEIKTHLARLTEGALEQPLT